MKTFALDEKNIEKVISSLKKQSKQISKRPRPTGILIPKSLKTLNRNLYKGYGRPRKSDYDYTDFIQAANKIIKGY